MRLRNLRNSDYGSRTHWPCSRTGCASPCTSQNGPRGGHGMGQDFHGVGGQVTAIDGSTITLQSFRGETAKVQITSSTRFTKDRSEAKLSDFKVGDRVFVSGGQGKDGVWTAQVLGKRTAKAAARRSDGAAEA